MPDVLYEVAGGQTTTTTYTYTYGTQLTSSYRWNTNGGTHTSYTYDASGNQTNRYITDTNNITATTRYDFDYAGRLSGVVASTAAGGSVHTDYSYTTGATRRTIPNTVL
mgnify:CR=1 FL=1